MSEETSVFTRIRSSRSRVICETLTPDKDDCRHLDDAEGELLRDLEEYTVVTKADPDEAKAQHVQHHGELANGHENCQNPENPGQLQDIKEKFPSTVRRQRRGIPPWINKLSLCDCNISEVTNPGRRKRSTRPSAGSVPRSSVLLPHSGPILFPIGGHSGSFRSKPAVLVKSSSIISSATANKISVLLVKDPSSPRVTCLGRVRSNQNGHTHDTNPDCVAFERGKLKGRHLTYSTQDIMTKENKDGSSDDFNSISIHHKGQMNSMARHSDDRMNGKERNSSPFMLRETTLRREATLAIRCMRKKESKEWLCNVAKLASHSSDQKWEVVSRLKGSYPEAKVCVNLKGPGSTMPSPWIDEAQKFEDIADGQDVTQSPPRDALLRMKNIISKRVQTLEQLEENRRCKAQEPASKECLMPEESNCEGLNRSILKCLPPSGSPILQETNFADASSSRVMLPGNTNFLEAQPSNSACITHCRSNYQQKESALPSQAPLPKAHLNLCQRRGVGKAYTVDVRNPGLSDSQRCRITCARKI